MKQKKFLALVLALSVFATLLAGCGAKKDSTAAADTGKTGGAASTGETVKLTIAHIGALESPSNLAVEEFIRLVDEASGGMIQITNYPASQLGGDRDILEQITDGSVDMGIPAAGIVANIMPEYAVFDCVYMFKDQEHLTKVANGEIGDELAAKLLEKTGVRVLTSNWQRGTRQCIFTKPVDSLADLEGVKMRIPEIDNYLTAFELLGVSGTIINFSETYTSLQQGVVEGMECPLDWIYDNNFYEVCKHLVISNHVYSVMTFVINDESFSKLSAEQQQILTDCAKQAGEYENQLLADKESEYLEKMKEAGVTVHEPDLTEWIAAVQPMFDQYVDSWGQDLFDRIQAAAN